MPVIKIIFILYGVLLCGGAFFGLKAGSKISLYMGIASGLLVFYAATMVGSNPAGGLTLIAVVSGILSLVFLIRLVKTKKFMPAGMLLIVSIPILILSINQLLSA